MTREDMINTYEGKTTAQGYIFGFEFSGDIYSVDTDSLQIVNDSLKLDKTSIARGGFSKIRVRFSKLDKIKLINSKKAVKVGAMNVMAYADKYNAGEHFEHYIHELHGKTWVKDSVPFNVAGDIEINGKQIQIKFDGATLTDERALARA